MNTRFLGFGLALGLCAQALAQLSPGNPLAGLEKLKDFEAMRASSSDPDWRNGNGDCASHRARRHADAGGPARARA